MPSTNGHSPKQAILYARVSTEEQVRHGYSLDGQIERLREYAIREGYEVLEEVTDPGWSGACLERPGIDRVRDLVAAGGVAVVLAQERDRFSREPAYLYLLREEFAENGTKLRALNDLGDDTLEGELGEAVLDQIASYQRKKLAQKGNQGKLDKVRTGKILAGRTPRYGFRYNETNDGYLVDPETMPLVRRIFRMMGAERMSIYRVKRTLEVEGIPTPGGGKYWDKTFFRDCVLNDCYRPHTFEEIEGLVAEGLMKPEVAARLDPEKTYGIWWFNRYRHTRNTVAEIGPDGRRVYKKKQKCVPKPREEWIAVPVPDAGIPRELVDAAREAIKDNYRPSKREDRFWELSGGVLICGDCGSRMQTDGRRKKPDSHYYHYYRCPRRQNKGKEACSQSRSYRAEELENLVWSSVSDYLKEPERLRAGLQRMIEEKREAMRGDPEREAKVWLDRIAKADRQRARAQDLAIEGLLSPNELRGKLAPLEEQRKTAQRELEALRSQAEELANLELEADALLEQYARITPEGLDAFTPEDRHQAYKELRLRWFVYPDGRMEAEGIFNLDGAPSLCTSGGHTEVMPITDEVEALALARSSAEEIGRAAVKGGMVRMRADGLLKAAGGVTPIEEILRTTM